MAELSPDQISFLRTHLGFDAAGFFQKRKLKSQLEKFWRRREKAQAELDILPPDHPRRKEFTDAISAATKTAEGGDLKAAYDTLAAVKVAARAEAGTVRNGLSLDTVNGDLKNLLDKTAAVKAFWDRKMADMNARADRQELLATMTIDVSNAADRDEIVRTAGLLVSAKRDFLARQDQMDADARQQKSDFRALLQAAPDTKTTLDRLEHNAKLLRDAGKMIGSVEAQLATVNQRVAEYKMLGTGSDFDNAIDGRLRDCRKFVMEELEARMKLPAMEPSGSTDHEGNRLSADAAELAVSELKAEGEEFGLKSVFADIEKRDAERIEAAKARMAAASNLDRWALPQTVNLKPVTPSRVDTFKTSDAIDSSLFAYDPFDEAVSADQLTGEATRFLDALLEPMAESYLDPVMGGGKVPDELLEVASRTFDTWCQEVAESFGEAWAPDTLASAKKERIQAVAKSLRARAQELYPDRAAADMSSFTMGGETFDDVKQLGKGGGGTVFLATSPSGRQVVIKTPNDLDDFTGSEEREAMTEEMRREILAQRAITGGETGVCPANLLEHQGMVLGTEGVPLPVMDLADAGDVSEYGTTMTAAQEAGLINETARQALMNVQMRDVLQGVKAMHDQGFAHFDLKELNVFMMKDGTFKVADFGLAQSFEERDQTLEDMFETTPLYKAPEIEGSEDLTERGDMFSLGAMLRRVIDPLKGAGKHIENYGYMNAGPAATTDDTGDVVAVSASSRLASALMSDDPMQRPTIEAALMSSYFDDVERDYASEDVERLRKAAANYAATIGRATKKLDSSIESTRSSIMRKERHLSGDAKRDLLKNAELKVKQLLDQIERLKQGIARETDPKKKAGLERSLSIAEDDIEKVRKKVQTYRAENGKSLDDTERRRIRDQLEQERAKLKDLREKADAIRNDPKYADILQEMKDANAPFV